MDMNSREKAQLQPKTDTSVALAEPSQNETESYLAEISDHLMTIRSHQGVVQDRFTTVSKNLEQSNEARIELLNKVNHAIKGLEQRQQKFTQEVLDTLKTQNRTLNTRLETKEKELTQALTEVQKLKQELLNGFMNLHSKSKEPLSHKLYKVGTISLGSIMGGLIIFLIMRILWP
ncbi:hypothetical protein [Alicyclobacillus fodiniaquatilis]|uniref:Uncharacterized protein n=1 Tax=Alicyclobacillus fodiniaquatilis TaxID=1661150 RepID=A0ABW4JKQ1_9BACL